MRFPQYLHGKELPSFLSNSLLDEYNLVREKERDTKKVRTCRIIVLPVCNYKIQFQAIAHSRVMYRTFPNDPFPNTRSMGKNI
jgi:hypothetical protein